MAKCKAEEAAKFEAKDPERSITLILRWNRRVRFDAFSCLRIS